MSQEKPRRPAMRVSDKTLTEPLTMAHGTGMEVLLDFPGKLKKPHVLRVRPSWIQAAALDEGGEPIIVGDLTLETGSASKRVHLQVPPTTTPEDLAALSEVTFTLEDELGNEVATERVLVGGRRSVNVNVTEMPLLRKSSVASEYTDNLYLHQIIKEGAARLRFPTYKAFMDLLLCGTLPESEKFPDFFLGGRQSTTIDESTIKDVANGLAKRRALPFTDTDAYRILKIATESFVQVRSASFSELLDQTGRDAQVVKLAADIGARINGETSVLRSQLNTDYLANGFLPYLAIVFQRLGDSRLKDSIFPGFNLQENRFEDVVDSPGCEGVLRDKLLEPVFIELIWSYWHEQAMQVQTMFAVRNRFQNVSTGPANDPLAAMEIGFLRPLNNVLWGYIQDEQHRLTLVRRNYEYEHHYGLSLRGRAVPVTAPADRRSKFIEAFHNLLYLATVFFKEDDDTNRRADAFPVLHALKEVHFLLSEGAHNQFGDLPATSRVEMLMEQWLLSRPEFREFLPSRESIAYPEAWMAPVDAMKTMQGWTSTSVMFFNDLARFGEMLLLSIRYDRWSDAIDRNEAANWAKIWRSEIQGYIHAYRIVTGVDLSVEPAGIAAEERRKDPSLLIQQRWDEQKRAGLARPTYSRLPASPTAGAWAQPRLTKRA